METVGQRLRRLRRARGSSQADLASASVSASYISLLESDKRVPGPEVAEHLAAQLGCTAEYLLTGAEAPSSASARVDVTFAALALAEGHPAAALERLEAVDLSGLPEDLVEQARHQTARALLGVGALEQAIDLLEVALRQARGERRSLQALVLATTLSATYLQAGDLVRAVELAESCLQEGREARLDTSTEYVRLLATLTWALYERGDVYYARQRLREVLPVVESAGDARARGSVYWNAALFAQEVGHEAEATDLTRKALALIAEHSDQADLARLRLHLGWLLQRGADADPEAALQELRAAEPEIQQFANSFDVVSCLTEQARALIALARFEEALEHAHRALDKMRPPSAEGEVGEAPRFQSIEAHLVLAEAQDALGDSASASANYRKAADTVSMMATSRKAAEIWGTLAVRLKERGDLEGAMHAYQQAIEAAGIRSSAAANQNAASKRS